MAGAPRQERGDRIRSSFTDFMRRRSRERNRAVRVDDLPVSNDLHQQPLRGTPLG